MPDIPETPPPKPPPRPPPKPANAGVMTANAVETLIAARMCLVFIVDLLLTAAHRSAFTNEYDGTLAFLPSRFKFFLCGFQRPG
jgi:hypothetical protein